MGILSKAMGLLGMCAVLGSAQVQNVQFKDMAGNSYDLYSVLNSGKYVYVEMMFNG